GEMEGWGVAVGADLHDRHWCVVRGVADYCDDRTKNDLWHRYASLTAAAYTRSLLEACHPFGMSAPAQPVQGARAPARLAGLGAMSGARAGRPGGAAASRARGV